MQRRVQMLSHTQSRIGQIVLRILLIQMILFVTSFAEEQTQSEEGQSEDVARYPSGFGLSSFTGEVLPVFYVRDVLASVEFYVDKLGFVCHHYYDHISGGSVVKWVYDEPPIYAEMRAGDQKFALHLASKPDSLMVGGTRHYFSVSDVREHHRLVRQRGVDAGDLVERPWMNMFRVLDPDGHELYIFTRPPDWEE